MSKNINYSLESNEYKLLTLSDNNAIMLAKIINNNNTILVTLCSPYSQFHVLLTKIDLKITTNNLGFNTQINQLFVSIVNMGSFSFDLDTTKTRLGVYKGLKDPSYYNDVVFTNFITYLAEKLRINQFSNDCDVLDFIAKVMIELC